MSDGQRAEGLDLPAIAGILRRRALLIVLCVAVTALAAVGLALRQDKQYSATSSLLITDPGFGGRVFGQNYTGQFDTPDRLMATNLRLANLQIVAAQTARNFGEGITADDVSSKIDVGVQGPSNSDLASVTATVTDPARAARLANVFAKTFISFRQGADRAKVQPVLRRLDRSIARLRRTRGSPALQEQLRSRREDLKILSSLQTGNAELVQEATPPGSPSSPKPRRNGLIGAFLGLLLGLALALGREQLDRRLKHPDELEEQFGLPLLTSVPKSRELATSAMNGSPPVLPPVEGEAFRMLFANMRHFNPGREITSVLVTSPAAKDGKSTVSLNLAIAAAETGTNVLLIEADLRSPVLAGFLGVYAEKGLTSLLAEPDLNLSDVGWRIPAGQSKNGSSSASEPHMDVVFAGPHATNPTELLATNRMRELIREAEANYSLVVVDAPPVTMVSDAIPLLATVSGIIVVSRLGSNTRPLMKRLDEQLQRLETPALGLVANFATEHQPHYGYPYIYHYHQQEERPKRRFRILR